ncbi:MULTISPECIES: VTT domain-containing protein [Stappiaceae]|jgi:uncharacterized membrane protein YdjX (TVP38/TMEM64 family)|uniref:TVP38/TMEM64 family protein n=1 Tax=Stappiaceae TaxID=2821832 RepID=UPI00094ADCB8|nr:MULTISPECIES: VTT domain-containing protein [Stappiaceae]MBO9463242.1 TVP38/TMEM64 family protein [Labrenzia sp. R5_0]UES53899.1 TVP38/TMEM64 family protein [Roseibium aggregatum]UFI06757.1 VTT domain-containing protein [Roseibium aggregatum]
MKTGSSNIVKIVASIALSSIFLLFALGWRPNFFENFNSETVKTLVEHSGIWGPLFIIALMTLAIVVSPLPSAPIALAAGAAYGHTLGTIYVATGSCLGATIAFLIARKLGRNAIVRLLGEYANYGFLGSQNALTITVFTTRVIPFISFDAVSYAAGLSGLYLWRFIIATIAGIIPASFVLAHFGAEAMNGPIEPAELLTLGLGIFTALPLLWLTLRRRLRPKSWRDHRGHN